METHTMTNTHSNPARRLMARREQPHRAARVIYTAETPKVASPRTWPVRETLINLDDFELEIFGAVRRALKLDWHHLTSLPTASIDADLDSRSVKRRRRHWAGASLRHLLKEADVGTGVLRATLYSDGGYHAHFGIHELLQEGGVLAYEVDGQPLTRSDGGPVRLVLPRLKPWRCAKWVRGISLEDETAF